MLRQERKIKAKKYPDGGKTYANKQGVIMGPVQNPDGSYTLPVSTEGLPQVNLPEFEVVSTQTGYAPGERIEERKDFRPWWNFASTQAGGGERRQESYGALGDLYAYYSGQPLKHQALYKSQYKPTNSKNPNASYIAIKDDKFKQEIIDNYERVFLDKNLYKGEKQINDKTYAVSEIGRAHV